MLLDILYLIGTIAFFVLMQVYVAGCDRLGRMNESDDGSKEQRP